MKDIRFDGKLAVVTGAASGMGLHSTKQFVNLGAKVIMCDVNQAALDAAASEIGPSAIPVCGDVRDYTYAEKVPHLFLENADAPDGGEEKRCHHFIGFCDRL